MYGFNVEISLLKSLVKWGERNQIIWRTDLSFGRSCEFGIPPEGMAECVVTLCILLSTIIQRIG